jgi:hypothetical protein
MLADFESRELQTLFGVPWLVFNDAVVGGKSTVEIARSTGGAKGTKAAMALTGKLTTDFQWGGFCGVTAMLRKDRKPSDLSGFTGVQFYVRGDGKTYRVVLGEEDVKDENHFTGSFVADADWKLVRVPFSELAQSPMGLELSGPRLTSSRLGLWRRQNRVLNRTSGWKLITSRSTRKVSSA